MNTQLDTLVIPPLPNGSTPRWLTEDYPEKEADISDSLYAYFYWTQVNGLKDLGGHTRPPKTPQTDWLDHVLAELSHDEQQLVKSRISQTAATLVAPKADEMQDVFSRVSYGAMWVVNRRNFWQNTPEEYGSFEEWLLDRFPRLQEENKAGELSDTLFLMSDLLPLMEKIGGDFAPDTLLTLKDHWTKTRRSVPYGRMATRRFLEATREVDQQMEQTKQEISTWQKDVDKYPEDAEEHQTALKEMTKLAKKLPKLEEERRKVEKKAAKQFSKAVQNIVEVVSDPKIANPMVPLALAKRDAGQDFTTFTGMQAQLPNETMFLFTVPANVQSAITSALKRIVEFQVTDPKAILKELNKIVHAYEEPPEEEEDE